MNYWDFPRCREAFARGQKDARPEEHDGCYYRRRGRTTKHYTLLSFEDPLKAWKQLWQFRQDGARIQCVNYTSPNVEKCAATMGEYIKKGPIEWEVESFPTMVEQATGPHAKRLRQLQRDITVDYFPGSNAAFEVFKIWEQWARGRHFMVFKGHYLKWLEMYFDERGNCNLVGVVKKGKLEGIFGWETCGDLVQITIAKHTSDLQGKELWVAGLKAIGNKKVLCGSTADKLKSELGLTPKESWTFDLSKI